MGGVGNGLKGVRRYGWEVAEGSGVASNVKELVGVGKSWVGRCNGAWFGQIWGVLRKWGDFSKCYHKRHMTNFMSIYLTADINWT